jgi:uncharacterized protein
MNYAQVAFSDTAKKLQSFFGSRRAYSQKERFDVKEGFSENEIRFIADQDHFFLASVGENGFPYIQHRGGSKGFLKVLDNKTLGLIDFAGNKQYISVGNILTNPKVSLILISYSHQARLKIYAEVKTVEIAENQELFNKLQITDYKHKPERMMVFDIVAFDWNCPQQITPRFTEEEIREIFTTKD